MSQPPEEPQIVTYHIPRIEVYHVTDDELTRIEDGYGQVGQDLTFAVTSISFCIAFAIALATADFSERLFMMFLLLVIAFAILGLYTGIRWWRVRKTVPTVLVKIRSRKVEPRVSQGSEPEA